MSFLFRIPYRWLPRTLLANVRYIYHDITCGFGNVVRWVPVIWFDRDWDYDPLLWVMEFKLGRMSKCLENGHLLNAPRYARQTQIGAHLCKRIREDDYYEDLDKRYANWTHGVLHGQTIREQDKEMLGKLIGKYIDHWWD